MRISAGCRCGSNTHRHSTAHGNATVMNARVMNANARMTNASTTPAAKCEGVS